MIDIGKLGAIRVTDGRGTPFTFYLLFWLTYGLLLFVWPFVAIARDLAMWPATAYLVALTSLLVAGCYRSWRIALLIGDDGLVVRNFVRSWRIGWPQVARLVDGYPSSGFWALTVLLANGGAITVTATAKMGASLGDPRMLSILQQAAARHGIAHELTGIPAWRPRAWESFKLFCDDQLRFVREEAADPRDTEGLPTWALTSASGLINGLSQRLEAL